MKSIRLTRHALDYVEKRGFTPAEVEETIRSVPWQLSELGRKECQKEFNYHQLWNGKLYAVKQVRPIFVEEKDEIVVVTVYTYFY